MQLTITSITFLLDEVQIEAEKVKLTFPVSMITEITFYQHCMEIATADKTGFNSFFTKDISHRLETLLWLGKGNLMKTSFKCPTSDVRASGVYNVSRPAKKATASLKTRLKTIPKGKTNDDRH